jgi:hypothetical protein
MIRTFCFLGRFLGITTKTQANHCIFLTVHRFKLFPLKSLGRIANMFRQRMTPKKPVLGRVSACAVRPETLILLY